MRGKVMLESWSRYETRITPAYAGKSSVRSCTSKHRRDHPRLCGEKGECVDLVKKHLGSPPPMRGKAGKLIRRQSGKGITPAYAGKSRNAGVVVPLIGDHPRLCGEKKF